MGNNIRCLSEGIDARTEGIASIDFLPFAIETSKVRLSPISESRKGVYPSSASLKISVQEPIYSRENSPEL